MSVSIGLGIFSAIIATILFNLGPVLQKKSLNNLEEISFRNIRSTLKLLFCNKRWMLGFLLQGIGGLFHKLAVNYAGVSVTQPIMALGFIILAFFAQKYLNETLSKGGKLAIVLLSIMPIFIVFADVSAVFFNFSNRVHLNGLIVVSIVFVIIFLFSISFSNRYPYLISVVTALSFGFGAIFLQTFMAYLVFQGLDLMHDIKEIVFFLFSSRSMLNG